MSAIFQVLGDAVQRLDTDAIAAGDEAAGEHPNEVILPHNQLQRLTDHVAGLQMTERLGDARSL